MPADSLNQMIEATFQYFGVMGDWHKDPEGVQAVREMKESMIQDLEVFSEAPTKSDLQELCREWRSRRIELEGEASYPPDMFIESVCQVIEISWFLQENGEFRWTSEFLWRDSRRLHVSCVQTT